MKQTILTILNQHKNQYISGEQISKQLNISRVAISKHIKKLREEGYLITSQTNKGYCFSEDNDVLCKKVIQNDLPAFYQDIEIVDAVTSTNDVLKQKADDLENGYVLIANTQSKGKGRNGKTFHSPKQSGIYFSIFLRPSFSIAQSLKVTACASVAIYDAIYKNYAIQSEIKWVNDIMIQAKKIAGILCEASLELNSASLDYMIVGIGINLHDYQMPEELQEIASSVESFTSLKVERSKIIHDILVAFEYNYRTLDKNTFLPIYKEHSYVLFKDIMVHNKTTSFPARVLDIDENANLVIQKEDKSIATLSSGEVSIRINSTET